mgnify:CR=1 FL=1
METPTGWENSWTIVLQDYLNFLLVEPLKITLMLHVEIPLTSFYTATYVTFPLNSWERNKFGDNLEYFMLIKIASCSNLYSILRVLLFELGKFVKLTPPKYYANIKLELLFDHSPNNAATYLWKRWWNLEESGQPTPHIRDKRHLVICDLHFKNHNNSLKWFCAKDSKIITINNHCPTDLLIIFWNILSTSGQ